LLIVETGNERWMFPSQRCAWTPPNCKHAARSVGGAAGSMVDLSPEMCRGLPKTPCMFNSSELLFAIVHRMVDWDLSQPLNAAKKHLITMLRDEIRQPEQQPLRLTIPREERLARVADALLDDVGDDRTLDAWAHVAGMSRRTFMRAFLAEAGMSFGRWRQQARLFAALEMLAQRKSVTEVAIAVGYDSISAFHRNVSDDAGNHSTNILSRQAFVATSQRHGRNGAPPLTLSRSGVKNSSGSSVPSLQNV
jgi:AraC-like DNA-binding protein